MIKNIKDVTITRINHTQRNIQKDRIVCEIPFTILLNGQEIATVLCTPQKFEYLAVGFLFSEGIIKNDTRIKKISMGKDGYYADIQIDRKFQLPQKFFEKRVIVPGCGKHPSFYNPRDIKDCKPTNSDMRMRYKQTIALMTQFQKESSLFKETGGVHSAALCSPEKIEIFAEDIGRHNAIDKIFGECFLKNIPIENKVVLTSGRISSDIIIKIVRRGIPIIISPGAPTDLAISFAEEMRVTVIGFVRGRRMSIYTHNFRIEKS